MLLKDKIKSGVALSLLFILVATSFIAGKNAIIMKYLSAFCLITWVTTMLLVNRKYK